MNFSQPCKYLKQHTLFDRSSKYSSVFIISPVVDKKWIINC